MLIAVGHLTALLLLTLVNDGIMAQQRSTDQSASDVLVVGRNKRLFLLSSDVFRSRRNNWISNSNRDDINTNVELDSEPVVVKQRSYVRSSPSPSPQQGSRSSRACFFTPIMCNLQQFNSGVDDGSELRVIRPLTVNSAAGSRKRQNAHQNALLQRWRTAEKSARFRL